MGILEVNVFLYKDKYIKIDKGFLEIVKNIGLLFLIIKIYIVYIVMNNFLKNIYLFNCFCILLINLFRFIIKRWYWYFFKILFFLNVVDNDDFDEISKG